jgi:hypothetical protein
MEERMTTATEIDYGQVADNLDRAADLIWMYGRCTTEGVDADGRMCILAGVAAAKGREGYDAWVEELACEDDSDWSVVLPASPEALALEWFIGTNPDLAHIADQSWGGSDRWGVFGNRAYNFNDMLAETPENDALVIDTMRRTAKAVRDLAEVGV